MKKAIKITLIVVGVLAALYAVILTWASKVFGEIEPSYDDGYDEFDYFEEES